MLALKNPHERTYVAERSPLEIAKDYLNSRFPYHKTESGTEVFSRVAAIVAPEMRDAAETDFHVYENEGIVPLYIATWNAMATEDYLHWPFST